MTDDHPTTSQPDEPAVTGRRVGRAGRWALIAVLAIVILVVLFTTVFPWIERSLSTPTLGG